MTQKDGSDTPETNESLRKLSILLSNKDLDYVEQGIDLLSTMITVDDSLYEAFSDGKICAVDDTGKLTINQRWADQDQSSWTLTAFVKVFALLAEQYQDPYALNITRLDLSKISWQNEPLPDEIAALQNLEWLDLGSNWKVKTFPEALDSLSKLKHLNINRTGISLPNEAGFRQCSAIQQQALFLKAVSTSYQNDIVLAYASVNPSVLTPFAHTASIDERGNLEYDFSKKDFSCNVAWRMKRPLFWLLAEAGLMDYTTITQLGQTASSKHIAAIQRMSNLTQLSLSASADAEVDLSSLRHLTSLKISGRCRRLLLPASLTNVEIQQWDQPDDFEVVVGQNTTNQLPMALSSLPSLEVVSLKNIVCLPAPPIGDITNYTSVVTQAFLKWGLKEPSGYDTAMVFFDADPEQLLRPYLGTMKVDPTRKRTTVNFTRPEGWTGGRVTDRDLAEKIFARLHTLNDPNTNVSSIHCLSQNAHSLGRNSAITDMYIQVQEEPIDLRHSKVQSIKLKGKRVLVEFPSGNKTLHRPRFPSIQLPETVVDFQMETVAANANILEQLPVDLQVLSLSNIRWQEMPDLSRFTKLHTLKLINCALTSLPELPNTIEHLYISGNAFGEVPAAVLKLANLSSLYLSNCNVSSLPQALCALTKLERLSISNNPLLEQEVETILGQLPNLKQLHIGSRKALILKGDFPSLQELKLSKVVWLHLDSFEHRELKILNLSSCSNSPKKHAAMFCRKVHNIVGQDVVYYKEENGTFRSQKIAKGRHYYGGSPVFIPPSTQKQTIKITEFKDGMDYYNQS